ncbi:transposase [Streptomyces sp. NPDC048577]|uniref:transposase n=1 Tax=Streptomyces sp. NPDC048577 TaxID=3157209 RepID=UPI00342205AF
METERAVQTWSGWFEDFFAGLAWVFGRADRRRTAMAYLKALIAPVERKNGWQIAEYVGHATPDRVQWFLSRSTWLADQLRDCVRSFVVTHLQGCCRGRSSPCSSRVGSCGRPGARWDKCSSGRGTYGSAVWAEPSPEPLASWRHPRTPEHGRPLFGLHRSPALCAAGPGSGAAAVTRGDGYTRRHSRDFAASLPNTHGGAATVLGTAPAGLAGRHPGGGQPGGRDLFGKGLAKRREGGGAGPLFPGEARRTKERRAS